MMVQDHTLPSVVVVIDFLPGDMFFLSRTILVHLYCFEAVIWIEKDDVHSIGSLQRRLVPLFSAIRCQRFSKKAGIEDIALFHSLNGSIFLYKIRQTIEQLRIIPPICIWLM